MKKLKFSITIIALALLGTSTAFAQADGLTSTQQVNLTVGGSSLIRADGAVSLSLSAGATQAGQSLLARSVDASSRLKISSLTSMSGDVPAVELKNKITAKITTGTLNLTHTRLFLRLLTPTSPTNFINYPGLTSLNNQGNQTVLVGEVSQTLPVDGALLGTSASATNNEVTLAHAVGFCWSGTGPDDGFAIEYTYASTNDGTTQAPAGGALTITYTIAADI